ncbi:MAG TPA: FtsX-like permease family protein [Rheinheimera sp.]|nr:FtsX-like permease family protein [Rheinheimera sp.]
MFSQNLALAWHFFRQQRQQRHQRLLRGLQTILMVFIVTLSQTSANIQAYLSQNLNNLLGADLVLSQPQALNESQYAELAAMSQQIVLTQSLTTTLTHNGQWQRATLKGVAEDYPLHGELRSSTSLAGSDTVTSAGPATGEIWLDSRLLASLSLRIGEPLAIAGQTLSVTRILQHEPDRLMEGHNVNMRALMHSEDFTRFNFAADSVQQRYLVAANPAQIKQIMAWQKARLPAAQLQHKQGAPPLALFWQRTENFIGLAAIILFFMAAIAIRQLTQLQLRKEQFFSAVCQSLGASSSSAVQVSVIKWLLGLVFLLPAVLLLSALCHWALIRWLSPNFAGLSWQWHNLLAAQTLLATAAMFCLFQLPVWAGLYRVSLAQLIHNRQRKLSHGLSSGCALLVLLAVTLAYSDNGLLTAMLLTAMATTIVLMLAGSWLLLSVGEKLTSNISGLLPFALYMMKQRLLSKTTQILGVGLSVLLLLFSLMLLKDLSSSMQAYQRQHDGNLLVSQASSEQMADIATWAAKHNVAIRQQKPFIYAKLTRVNSVHLADFSQKPSDSLATFNRPVRLHWSDVVPDNNRIVAGQWWQPDDDNWQQVAVEQEVMTDLGLQLGDRLSFFIAGNSIELVIVASHEYKPGAGSITFWLQMPGSALKHISAPHYTMASLELADGHFALLAELWQAHPSLRMVSLQEMTQRFDSTLAMVTQVISGFSALIILLAAIVIVAAIHAQEAQEKQKNSIILSFGFSRATCLKLTAIEWLVTGAIAAIGAIIGTWLAGLLIYQSQFSLPYQPDVIWLLATLAIILVLVTALGIAAGKHSLAGSVRQLMAE